MASLTIPAPAVTGTVTATPNEPITGSTGFKVIAGSSYNQYTITSVLARTYFFSIYFQMLSLPTALARIWHLIDTSNEAVCSLRVSPAGVLQMFDHEGNQFGASIGLDLSKVYLLEPVVKQNVAGNGVTSLLVDKEPLNENFSTVLTNTAWNRMRSGIDVTAESTKGFFQYINGLNDSTGGENTSYVTGTKVYPAIPSKIIPSGLGRVARIPGGLTNVNNVPIKSNSYHAAVRWIPNEDMNLYRWLCGFNMEGVKLDELGANAPEEIRGSNYGGKGRIGYADGNGGTIRARLVKCLPSGQPVMTTVLKEEEINAVKRYKEAHTAYGIESEKINQMLFFNGGGVALEGGQMYAWVFSNTDGTPLANFFSLNFPTTSIAAAGPNAVNTLNRYVTGAIAGLDPREVVAWTVDNFAHWHWGPTVGGDTAAQGVVPPAAGGHISGQYNGFDIESQERVRLPWYGYQKEVGGSIQGIQPYYNYLETKEKAKLRIRKNPRTVTISSAGGYAPPGKNVGVITVTLPGQGVSATTASLGTGEQNGVLSKTLTYNAGETCIIECSGTVYVAQADSFLQKVYGLGSGDWSFSTDEMEVDRAELWLGEHPNFAAPLAEPTLPGLGVGTLGSGTLGEPLEPEVVPTIAPGIAILSPQLMPDHLYVRVDPPGTRGASPARWAEDEKMPHNILDDIAVSDEMSGGYKDFSCSLARDPTRMYQDTAPYGDVKVCGAGNEPVWEGSMDKTPSNTGDETMVTPAALGYQYILSDDNAAQVGFINSDLSAWTDPSTSRHEALATAGIAPPGSIEIGFRDAGALLPAIMFIYERLTKGATGGEQWFYGNGIDLGKLLFNFSGTGEDAAWLDSATLALDDLTPYAAGAKAYKGKSAAEQIVEAVTAGFKYAVFQTWRTQAETELDPYTGVHRWEVPKVLGRHGISPRGVWPNIGLPVKNMIEYFVTNFCQPLYVDPEYIDDDTYNVPHAWFGDPESLSSILNTIIKTGLYDWFVYNGKRLEYRKPGTYGKFWKALYAPSQLNEVGEDSQRLWRTITVRYQETDGSSRLVGAAGSGCRVESSELEITDPEHPAVKAGRTRRDILDLQGISNPETAIAAGKRFLEEANLLNRSGSATLTGYVLDDRGIMLPASRVKSGDYIAFTDSSDTSYRKIVNKSYTHKDRASEIDLDAPPSGLEALLERLQAGLISQGVS